MTNRPILTMAASAFLAFGVLAMSASNAQEIKLESDKEKFSYTLGVQFGSQIKTGLQRDNFDIDPAVFSKGIQDAIADTGFKLTPEEMQAIMAKRQEKLKAERDALANEAKQKGEVFRNEYKTKEGVSVTETGVLYKVMTEGDGKQPGGEDTVVVHYRGTLTDGTEFDSSYKRGQPATFSLSGIIAGWREILQLMKTGSKWEVVIPPEQGYGERGAGGSIGPNETLVFEIELIEVK